jgi:hypothetical protein
MKRIEALLYTIKHNDKFKDFDFHIYMSEHAQEVFPNNCIDDLSRHNVVLYNTLADITT